MINQFILNFILLIHLAFVLFVILTPFLNINILLLFHVIFIPFIVFHWYLNDNTCVLTIVEKKIRKNITGIEPKEEDCISFNLVAPVYDFNRNYKNFEAFIYILTITLWSISLYRLYNIYDNKKYDSIRDFIISL
jgi:hypothetical protein